MSNNTRPYALVTGASSGLGWHLSELLAQKGYHLIAVSNQPAELEELKKNLELTYSISVLTVNMDLAREVAAKLLFDYCEEKDLPVEVLINNAGMMNKLTIWLLPFVPHFIIGLIYRSSRPVS